MSSRHKAMVIDCAECGAHNWALLTDTRTKSQQLICLDCYHAWVWPHRKWRFGTREIKDLVKLVVIF